MKIKPVFQKFSEKTKELEKRENFNADEYYELFKDSEPLQYFIHYTRYKYILDIEFTKDSRFGKTLSLIKPVIKDAFFTCDIQENGNKFQLSICFADYMRFLILNKLYVCFGFKKDKLRKIALLLRYSLSCRPSKISFFDKLKKLKNKELRSDIDMYVTSPDVFEYVCKGPYGKEKYEKRLSEIVEYMDGCGIDLLFNYFEEDRFEEALFYTFRYQKPVILSINDKYGEYKLSYLLKSSDLDLCSLGVFFNILFILSETNTEFKMDLTEVSRNAVLKSFSHEKGSFNYKSEYIDGLRKQSYELLSQICDNIDKGIENEELIAERKRLEEKIQKNGIELTLGMYDVDEEVINVPIEFSQMFADLAEAIKHTQSSEFKMRVKNGVPEYLDHKFSGGKEDLKMYEEMKEYVQNGDIGSIGPVWVGGCKTGFEGHKKYKYKKKIKKSGK